MAFINWQQFGVNVPTRLGIGVMLFMACLISYMMRVNLSINIIAMVNGTDNNSMNSTGDGEPQFNWTSYKQGVLLGSYFWGYLCTSLWGGILAERFGGKTIAGYSMLISVLLTAVTPISACWDFWVIFGARFFIGVFGGVLYPSCHNLVSRWSPPEEKGKFVASLMGGTFGPVITWPISGLIIQHLGWAWAFYACAIFASVVTVLWFAFVANNPSEHKFISAEEKQYIEKSLSESLSNTKKWPPVLKLATSVPFLALILLHFGSMWGLYFLLTAAPKFMSEALGFNLSAAGFLSSLPYLARLFAAFIFGSIGDYIRKRDKLSVTMIRKVFCIFSHVLPGILLIILAYSGNDPIVCVAIITMSLGLNGAASLTNLQNSQDLAPNFAGTLYGIINFFGTLPGIFSPLIVAHFTKESSTVENWRYVFFIGAAVYIIPSIFFAFFGSGQVQKWNFNNEKQSNDTKL